MTIRHLVLGTWALLGVACTNGGKSDDDDDGSSESEAVPSSTCEGASAVSGTMLTLEDGQNYSFHVGLTAPAVEVAEGSDLTVSWAAAATDLEGNPIDPASDVAQVHFMRFIDSSQADVVDTFLASGLDQSSLAIYATFDNSGGRTSASLSDFGIFGTGVDPDTAIEADDGDTFLFAALAGSNLGGPEDPPLGVVFVAPSSSSTNTDAAMDSEVQHFDVEADLTAGDRVPCELAEEYWVDWTGLTVDARGAPLAVEDVDGMIVARIDLTLAEASDHFLDLESLAEDWYEADHGEIGSASLSTLEDATGATFAGFDGAGNWLLGLTCSTCDGREPVFIGAID